MRLRPSFKGKKTAVAVVRNDFVPPVPPNAGIGRSDGKGTYQQQLGDQIHGKGKTPNLQKGKGDSAKAATSSTATSSGEPAVAGKGTCPDANGKGAAGAGQAPAGIWFDASVPGQPAVATGKAHPHGKGQSHAEQPAVAEPTSWWSRGWDERQQPQQPLQQAWDGSSDWTHGQQEWRGQNWSYSSNSWNHHGWNGHQHWWQ